MFTCLSQWQFVAERNRVKDAKIEGRLVVELIIELVIELSSRVASRTEGWMQRLDWIRCLKTDGPSYFFALKRLSSS
jgi:hypothetical protein